MSCTIGPSLAWAVSTSDAWTSDVGLEAFDGEAGGEGTGDMASFKQGYWDERYAASELVWGAEPNRFVAEHFAPRAAGGRVLDLACGEGRNAIWLAEQGFEVTAVDFSRVALDRGARLAQQRRAAVDFVHADVESYEPEPDAFAWVVVAYLQLPSRQMQNVWSRAARAVAPEGGLFAIGHALANLESGHAGPRDPDVLWQVDVVAAELVRAGLSVDDARDVERPVVDAPRPAIDARIVARRDAASGSAERPSAT